MVSPSDNLVQNNNQKWYLSYSINLSEKSIYTFLFVLSLIYSTLLIRIMNPLVNNEHLTYSLLVIEEYVLLFILLVCYFLRNSIKIPDITMTVLVIAYMYFSAWIKHDADIYYLKLSIFFFLHYLVYINIFERLDKRIVFYILMLYGFLISIFYINLMYSNVNIIASTEVAGHLGKRGSSEEFGMLTNVNNISMILVGISTLLVVIKHNFEISKKMILLSLILHLTVLLVLIINATVSAILFFISLLIYDLYKMYGFSSFAVLLLIISVIGYFGFNISNLLIFQRAESGATFDIRIINMMQSLDIFKNNPFFGIGHSLIAEIETGLVYSTDHNFYTKLLGAEGMIGFLLYGCFFYNFLRSRRVYFKGLNLLRFYFLFFLIFTPAGCSVMMIVAALIYEISGYYSISNNSHINENGYLI